MEEDNVNKSWKVKEMIFEKAAAWKTHNKAETEWKTEQKKRKERKLK